MAIFTLCSVWIRLIVLSLFPTTYLTASPGMLMISLVSDGYLSGFGLSTVCLGFAPVAMSFWMLSVIIFPARGVRWYPSSLRVSVAGWALMSLAVCTRGMSSLPKVRLNRFRTNWFSFCQLLYYSGQFLSSLHAIFSMSDIICPHHDVD